MISQEKQILRHLQAGKTLTPIQALNHFNCFRLGARIFSLKKKGHNISSKLIKTSSRKIVAEYSLTNQTKLNL